MEPTIIQCLEFSRREWLSALHESDRPAANDEPKQEPETTATEVRKNDNNVRI
jgi:hypothetical protein